MKRQRNISKELKTIYFVKVKFRAYKFTFGTMGSYLNNVQHCECTKRITAMLANDFLPDFVMMIVFMSFKSAVSSNTISLITVCGVFC